MAQIRFVKIECDKSAFTLKKSFNARVFVGAFDVSIVNILEREYY